MTESLALMIAPLLFEELSFKPSFQSFLSEKDTGELRLESLTLFLVKSLESVALLSSDLSLLLEELESLLPVHLRSSCSSPGWKMCSLQAEGARRPLETSSWPLSPLSTRLSPS